ncbi:hypothetical protein [Methylobacterium radiotolerans]|uniref:hypothetical protein n=1 Tax=Methylobacterium radiotolerans TaxID=31998 RepID=UPI0015F67391|nr:hypothetical protein [Methylobacterium radiotolerans]
MTSPDPDVILAAFHAYTARFGELPPLAAWYGPDAVLVELVDAAVRDGRRLAEVDFARAGGLEPVPPGALI